MLRGLDIRDMLIIDRLDIAFQPGLNVLTGETGAGKSILLDALGFVLGWRGRAELVRAGAAQGSVVAQFDIGPGHPAHGVLAESGLAPAEEGELVLRRVNLPDGRKTAWVNGTRVSGETLRALSAVLVELHGQQDDRGLLDPKGHRVLLDAFGGLQGQVAAVRAAWDVLRAARAAQAAAAARQADLRAEEEFLRHSVAELDRLDPQPGEEAVLDAARRRMQGAVRVREDIARAHAALGGQGAEGLVSDALRWLEDAAAGSGDWAEGRFDGPIAALARALDALGEAEQGVAAVIDALEVDPHALEAAEERLFAIRALARKHGVLPDDLAAFAEGLRGRLSALDAAEGDLAGHAAAVRAAQAAHDAAAADLSAGRAAAGARLAAAMAGELAPLKMERAHFDVALTPVPPGPEGAETVTFVVATNPGAPAGPIDRIASGGELSRFLLALKVCLTREAEGLTLIFDEIDRGVGGATADAVGRRLAQLARGAQVLVVTHSPQVAALGAHHWRVEKSVTGGVTTSTIIALDAGARVDEIARMLAGDVVTDAARDAARVLIDGADAA